MSHRSVTINAAILAGSSVGSYALGLLRDRLLASQFGAGSDLDIFNSSFIIPDFITNLLAAALTTAFVPIFIQLYRQSPARAWQTVNRLLTLMSAAILVTILLAWIFMPGLSQLVAPGFSETQRTLLIHTTRLLLIAPFLFCLSTVFGSALQGTDRFISYALSPLLYNIGIVSGIIILAPRFGISGVIIGVVLGAVLHAGIRLVELRRTDWQYQWSQTWHDPAITKTVWLMLPRIVGLLSVQVNLWTYNAVGSTLASGSITVFNLARNFQSLPVSLFGIALATAAFPALSTAYAKQDQPEFIQQLNWTMRQIIFFTLPAAVGMILLAQPLITVLLGRGAFTDEAIVATSITLTMFALSIPIESVLHVTARAFYARQNTVTPVVIAVIAMLVNIGVCWLMAPRIGTIGLALGFVITSATQVLLLLYWLKQKQIYHIEPSVFITLGKSVCACVIMALLVIGTNSLHLRALLTLIIGGMVGAGSYLVMALILRMPEMNTLKIIILQRLWPKRRP